LSLLILLSSCKNNPVDSGGGFLARAGPILFISDKSGTSQLYSMNEDGSDVQQLTNNPAFPILDAKWSPDGSKIALVSLTGDSLTYPFFRNIIFIMDADGKNKRPLTSQWAYVNDSTHGNLEYGGATTPVWSPDSKEVAYTRLMGPEALGNTDIFIATLQDGNEKRITGTLNMGEGPSDWSDNQNLLLAIVAGSYTDSFGEFVIFNEIVAYDMAGKTVYEWGKQDELWRWPILSSDGQRMALTIRQNGFESIYVMDFPSGVPAKVAGDGTRFKQPLSWSSDGLSILFNGGDLSQGKTYGRIFVVDIESGSQKEITPFRDSVYSFATSWRRR